MKIIKLFIGKHKYQLILLLEKYISSTKVTNYQVGIRTRNTVELLCIYEINFSSQESKYFLKVKKISIWTNLLNNIL